MKHQLDTLGLLRHSLQVPLLLNLEFVCSRIVCLRLFLRGSLFFSEVLLREREFSFGQKMHLQIKLNVTCLSHDLDANLNLLDLFFPKEFM